MLLFSSDFPHWQFDGDDIMPAGIPEKLHGKIRRDNALATYSRLAAQQRKAHGETRDRSACASFRLAARKLVDIKGRPIAVFNVKGEFFALANRCPHQGGSLCEGTLDRTGRGERARRLSLLAPRRDHPLPVARLGVRRAHRQILVRARRIRARQFPVSVAPGATLVEGPYVAETFPVSIEDDYVVLEA